MRLLSRREHGAQELRDKLVTKGYSQEESDLALLKCQELDLQSEKRFVESRFRARIRQGYGPRRIQQELQQLQIDDSLIQNELLQEKDNWFDYGFEVWAKKYQNHENPTYNDTQKQKQFLLYRGFYTDTIALIFKEIR